MQEPFGGYSRWRHCRFNFALTCHEIGVPVLVLESVRELKPLSVGINLQLNAVL